MAELVDLLFINTNISKPNNNVFALSDLILPLAERTCQATDRRKQMSLSHYLYVMGEALIAILTHEVWSKGNAPC